MRRLAASLKIVMAMSGCRQAGRETQKRGEDWENNGVSIMRGETERERERPRREVWPVGGNYDGIRELAIEMRVGLGWRFFTVSQPVSRPSMDVCLSPVSSLQQGWRGWHTDCVTD